jgi:hypothetical protein
MWRRASVATLVGLCCLSPIVLPWPRLRSFERQTLGARFVGLSDASEASDDIVLGTIDPKTLGFFKNKERTYVPSPRDLYALALRFLNHEKPVGIDVVFSEPDLDRLESDGAETDAAFAEALQAGLMRLHAAHPEGHGPLANAPQEPPFADGWESKLPLAVTAKLVAYDGLVEDHDERLSLTPLANVIGLQSVRFDIPWKVFVLDSEVLNAFGLSDGYLLITRGLLAKCAGLEERAAILAHEIAHVVRYRNLTELQAREVDVQADTAQDAMNKAFGEAPDPDVEALSSVAMQASSFLHKDRLEAYEYEAYHLAAVYLYRAGLPPHALANVLNKVKGERGDHEACSGHPAFSKRISALKAHTQGVR